MLTSAMTKIVQMTMTNTVNTRCHAIEHIKHFIDHFALLHHLIVVNLGSFFTSPCSEHTNVMYAPGGDSMNMTWATCGAHSVSIRLRRLCSDTHPHVKYAKLTINKTT